MYIVTKSPLGEWLFNAHLEYQRREGQRKTIGEFADVLGISRAYLTMLINGDREAISLEVTNRIYSVLGDPTIYDAAGYPRPNELVEALRPTLEKAPPLDRKKVDELKALVRQFLEDAGLPYLEHKADGDNQ